MACSPTTPLGPPPRGLNADSLQVILEIASYYYADMLSSRRVCRGWHAGVDAAVIYLNYKSNSRLDFNDCPFSDRYIPQHRLKLFRLAFLVMQTTLREVTLPFGFSPRPSVLGRLERLDMSTSSADFTREQRAALLDHPGRWKSVLLPTNKAQVMVIDRFYYNLETLYLEEYDDTPRNAVVSREQLQMLRHVRKVSLTRVAGSFLEKLTSLPCPETVQQFELHMSTVLVGSMTLVLTALSNLRVLHLNGCLLPQNELPTAITACATTLEDLRFAVQDCTLPSWSRVPLMPNLSTLEIERCRLDDGAWIATAAPNLTSIKLFGSLTQKAVDMCCSSFPQLTRLNVSGVQLRIAKPLPPQLVKLSLCGFTIEPSLTEAIFERRHSITSLELKAPSVSADHHDLSSLGLMPALVNLKLTHIFISNAVLNAWCVGVASKSLRELRIRDPGPGLTSLAPLLNLRRLICFECGETNLDSLAVRYLSRMSWLSEISIAGSLRMPVKLDLSAERRLLC